MARAAATCESTSVLHFSGVIKHEKLMRLLPALAAVRSSFARSWGIFERSSNQIGRAHV